MCCQRSTARCTTVCQQLSTARWSECEAGRTGATGGEEEPMCHLQLHGCPAAVAVFASCCGVLPKLLCTCSCDVKGLFFSKLWADETGYNLRAGVASRWKTVSGFKQHVHKFSLPMSCLWLVLPSGTCMRFDGSCLLVAHHCREPPKRFRPSQDGKPQKQ